MQVKKKLLRKVENDVLKCIPEVFDDVDRKDKVAVFDVFRSLLRKEEVADIDDERKTQLTTEVRDTLRDLVKMVDGEDALTSPAEALEKDDEETGTVEIPVAGAPPQENPVVVPPDGEPVKTREQVETTPPLGKPEVTTPVTGDGTTPSVITTEGRKVAERLLGSEGLNHSSFTRGMGGDSNNQKDREETKAEYDAILTDGQARKVVKKQGHDWFFISTTPAPAPGVQQ